MKNLREVNVKNRQNYFFNSMTNIKNFDLSFLSEDKISFKSTDSVIYDIKYFKNLDSANSLQILDFCFCRQEQRSIRKLHRTLE